MKELSSNPAEKKSVQVWTILSLNLKVNPKKGEHLMHIQNRRFCVGTSLTSAKPWHCVPSIPSVRRRGLCKDSFRPRVPVGHEKTGPLIPGNRATYLINTVYKSRRINDDAQCDETPYFVFGARRFPRKQRRNVIFARDQSGSFHLSTKANRTLHDTPSNVDILGTTQRVNRYCDSYSVYTKPDVCTSHVFFFFLKGQYAALKPEV